jgi:hypothetical protein
MLLLPFLRFLVDETTLLHDSGLAASPLLRDILGVGRGARCSPFPCSLWTDRPSAKREPRPVVRHRGPGVIFHRLLMCSRLTRNSSPLQRGQLKHRRERPHSRSSALRVRERRNSSVTLRCRSQKCSQLRRAESAWRCPLLKERRPPDAPRPVEIEQETLPQASPT